MTNNKSQQRKGRSRSRETVSNKPSVSAGDHSMAIGGNVENSTIILASQPKFVAPRMVLPFPQLFVGRDEVLNDLIANILLASEQTSSSMRMIALVGMGGVGKTTLATAVINDLKINEKFKDGILWTELGPNPDIMSLLAEWGKHLGEDFNSYSSPEARSRALSDALHNRKILLVVDNVWNSADARLFLVGGASCCAIITTRDVEVARALTREGIFPVNVLSQDASLELLKKISPDAFDEDMFGVRQLVGQVGGLPLGLMIAGRLLAEEWHAGLGVSGILAELRNRDKRLEMASESRSISAILRTSYDHLPTEISKRVFRLMGIFIVGGKPVAFSADAAAVVCELELRSLQKAVVNLVSRELVNVTKDGRYILHTVLVDYAATLMEDSEEYQARLIHAHYFLKIVKQYSDPRLGDWMKLDVEWDNIRSSLNWLCEKLDSLTPPDSPFLNLIVDFISPLLDVIQVRVPPEGIKWLEAGIIACQCLEKWRNKAWFTLTKGQIALKQGNLDQAIKDFEASEMQFDAIQDAEGVTYARGNQGSVYHIQGRYGKALEIYEQITRICESRDDQYGATIGYYNQAEIYSFVGNSQEALNQLNQALTLCRKENIGELLIKTLTLSSGIHLELGQIENALNECKEAYLISSQVNSMYFIGLSSRAMGEVLAMQDQMDISRNYFIDSIKLLTQSNAQLDLAETYEAFGNRLFQRGRTQEANNQWLNAKRIYELIGSNSKAQKISSLLQQVPSDK